MRAVSGTHATLLSVTYSIVAALPIPLVSHMFRFLPMRNSPMKFISAAQIFVAFINVPHLFCMFCVSTLMPTASTSHAFTVSLFYSFCGTL